MLPSGVLPSVNFLKVKPFKAKGSLSLEALSFEVFQHRIIYSGRNILNHLKSCLTSPKKVSCIKTQQTVSDINILTVYTHCILQKSSDRVTWILGSTVSFMILWSAESIFGQSLETNPPTDLFPTNRLTNPEIIEPFQIGNDNTEQKMPRDLSNKGLIHSSSYNAFKIIGNTFDCAMPMYWFHAVLRGSCPRPV